MSTFIRICAGNHYALNAVSPLIDTHTFLTNGHVVLYTVIDRSSLLSHRSWCSSTLKRNVTQTENLLNLRSSTPRRLQGLCLRFSQYISEDSSVIQELEAFRMCLVTEVHWSSRFHRSTLRHDECSRLKLVIGFWGYFWNNKVCFRVRRPVMGRLGG